MDIAKLLADKNCTCGRKHSCDIRCVCIETGAIKKLTPLTARYTSVLVVADENTYAAAGAQVMQALQGKQRRQVIFSGKTVLLPNEEAIGEITANLRDAQLIVGIGSGVIQDLCKYVAFEKQLPYYIVATAPSMDGYASTGAAMILGGMKVTVAAKVPEVILADPQVLNNAPMDMIQAGYGDIVGKYSALNDWRLSQIVNGEYFCQWIYDLTMQMVEQTLSLAQGLLKREAESVRVLMEALVVVGVAMSFAGSSRPASGSEHHLSHFFEITGIVHDKPYFSHGVDVAYSTVVTAQLREQLLSKPWPQVQYRPDRAAYEAEIARIYGSVARGCIDLQDKVGRYEMDMLPTYREKEAQIRKVLSEMPKASRIQKLLEDVKLDMTEFYHLYGQEKLEDALWYAKELKDRYTVLWMYYDLFGGERK